MVVRLGLNLATYPVYIYNQGSVIEKGLYHDRNSNHSMGRYDLFTQAVTWTRGNHRPGLLPVSNYSRAYNRVIDIPNC
jgi:hypothetical protein